MWLKLTLYRSERKQLVNMNEYESIEQMKGFACLWCKYDPDGTGTKHVVETMAEIELMLMGSKPSAPDPRERNVIGKDPIIAEIEEQFRTAG